MVQISGHTIGITMSILPTNSENSIKKYDLSRIESTFGQHVDKKCWLTSDGSKIPYNPKIHSRHWGDYEQLCTFNEMRDFLQSSPEHRPCLIPAAASLIALDIDRVKAESDPIPLEIVGLIRTHQFLYRAFSKWNGCAYHFIGTITWHVIGWESIQ